MSRKTLQLYLRFLLVIILAGCNSIGMEPTVNSMSAPTKMVEASPLPLSTSTSALASVNTNDCQNSFEKRELKKPYQTSQGKMRYTLSAQELDAYLAVMNIASVCIPESLGAAFINVDWDEAQNPATRGRMLSLGFENLYPGAGWSNGFLLYATYNFTTGSEYDIFARPEDRQALEQKELPNLIDVGGLPGFIRYVGGISMGLQPVFKTYVFPFEEDYLVVVYRIGVFEYEEASWIIQRLEMGQYPMADNTEAQAMDRLAFSVRFLASP
jgi:hypothetical protein